MISNLEVECMHAVMTCMLISDAGDALRNLKMMIRIGLGHLLCRHQDHENHQTLPTLRIIAASEANNF